DFERGGEAGRYGACHDLGNPVRTGPLDASLADSVYGFDELFAGNTARAHDNAGARVGNHLGGKARVLDGAIHGNIGVSRGVAHEAQVLPVDEVGGVDIDLAGDITA